MNLYLYSLYILSLALTCLAQDYANLPGSSYPYNQDQFNRNQDPRTTDNYLNPSNHDPNKYDNPYDPNRNKFGSDYDPNRNRFGSDYDPNRNKFSSEYDPNRSRYDQSSTGDSRYNQNPFNPNPYDNRNDPNVYEPENTPRPWDSGRFNPGDRTTSLEHESFIINEATYFIVASRMIRPGQIYKFSVNILRAKLQMTIKASISANGVEIADVSEKVKEGVPEILNMRVPATSVPGDYKLRVEGLYLDDPFGGKAFINETLLTFSKRFMTIFIQMDKPVYMQGQTVRFRTIPINTELSAFGRAIDVYILDPNRRIMKRWLSRQSNYGTVSLQYQLSDQPLFGEWIIRVEALGQVEESTFLVEEYYQTRFEVNVTMPAFFFNTDPYIYGRVMANYTSGAPVHGNLTLKATVRPIPQYRPRYYTQGQFNNRGQAGVPPQYSYGNSQYTRVRANYNPYLYNESGYQGVYGPETVDEYGRVLTRDPHHLPGQPNQIDQPDWWYDPQKVYTRIFNFDEKFPFWMTKPDIYGGRDPNYYNNNYNSNNNYNTATGSSYNTYNTATGSSYTNYYNNPYYDKLPYLRFFNGTYEFRYPMAELAQLVPVLDGVEVIITASVGDPFLDDIVEGYSIARIHNSSLAVTFLGGSPQVFKPAMPFDVYVSI